MIARDRRETLSRAAGPGRLDRCFPRIRADQTWCGRQWCAEQRDMISGGAVAPGLRELDLSSGHIQVGQVQFPLALGTAGSNTLVDDGGTLELSNTNVSAENVTINGGGSNGQGSLDNVAGNNTWSG